MPKKFPPLRSITRILSDAEEKDLLRAIVGSKNKGIVIDEFFIRRACYEYCDINVVPHSFSSTDKLASQGWYEDFIERHPKVKDCIGNYLDPVWTKTEDGSHPYPLPCIKQEKLEPINIITKIVYSKDHTDPEIIAIIVEDVANREETDNVEQVLLKTEENDANEALNDPSGVIGVQDSVPATKPKGGRQTKQELGPNPKRRRKSAKQLNAQEQEVFVETIATNTQEQVAHDVNDHSEGQSLDSVPVTTVGNLKTTKPKRVRKKPQILLKIEENDANEALNDPSGVIGVQDSVPVTATKPKGGRQTKQKLGPNPKEDENLQNN